MYDDTASPGPLGKPSLPKIPSDHPLRGWDPTDADSRNPWNAYTTSLTTSTTVFDVANGSSAQSILAHFTASDSFGNNLNHKLTIEGNYSLTTQGLIM